MSNARTLTIKTPRVYVPLLSPSRYKGAWGGRGCVHPDTCIDTPAGPVRIADFAGGEVLSFRDGRVVTASATKPEPFTVETLHEVEFADGRKIVCTDQHRFMTTRGWVSLAHLSMSDVVVSLPTVHPRTGSVPSEVAIRQVRNHSRQTYWDLHVADTNCYFAEGLLNHNSGKSHFFAELLVEDCLAMPGNCGGEGLRAVCIREVQKDLAQSSKALIESKLSILGLGEADGFRVYRELIQTPGDGLIIFKGMQDYTAESIKSLEGFHRAWWEEAQSATANSLNLLRPTIRWEDKDRGLESELWFGWNPRRPGDPIEQLLRGEHLPTGATVVRANWRDNPFFPAVMEQERQDDLRLRPEQYDHIWEGGFATVLQGAYYSRGLATARMEGRIGNVSADPLMALRIYCDIGGTGARADAFSMWVVQFIGREIRCLDYYEAVGQPIQAHVEWLRSRGYTPARASIWLPHDGVTQDRVYDVSYASALRGIGYDVTTVPNQGTGAATMRIEAGRRRLPLCWFDETRCKGGLDALGWYHEKRDPARNIGLGPNHDWSSHACDAFGLMAICYEEPRTMPTRMNAGPARSWRA